jgi:hypothetical protein
MTPIIGEATRSVALLNEWLKEKGCPQYAGLYATAARAYGVRWDLAIFQACLETGFWKFGGDVKVTQNNFAGIGARGGGDPGDSFPSPAAGIEAQIQNLALRAGVNVPIDQILSPYVRKNYEFIKARNTKNWEDLAGTWAADINYWKKIAVIAADFDSWAKNRQVPPTGDVTWFEMNRTPQGETACVAYAGSEPKAVLVSKDKKMLVDFFNQFPKANNVMIAVGKPLPDISESDPEGEPPERPSMGTPGQKRPWIKWASDIGKITTQGLYPKGFPEGAVVHHTAGRTLAGDHKALTDGPYPCLIIDRDGTLYQPMPLNRWGYHSGTHHHRTHVGIEICGAGLLTKTNEGFRSWFGQLYTPAEVRTVSGSRIPIPGHYHKFTSAQEATLIQLLLYLKNEAPDIFSFDRVIGHDEAMDSVGKYKAKNDPGGSLSMTMPELRARLKREFEGV